jgi:hypothetical protein
LRRNFFYFALLFSFQSFLIACWLSHWFGLNTSHWVLHSSFISRRANECGKTIASCKFHGCNNQTKRRHYSLTGITIVIIWLESDLIHFIHSRKVTNSCVLPHRVVCKMQLAVCWTTCTLRKLMTILTSTCTKWLGGCGNSMQSGLFPFTYGAMD